MSRGSVFNGFIRPRAFVCLPCRILRLSRLTAQSQSLPSQPSSRSFAKSAGKDLEKSQPEITTTSKKSQPTGTSVKTTSSRKRNLKRKAARKPQSKAEVKIKKVPGRQRRRAFIRKVRSNRLIEDQSIRGVSVKNEPVKTGSVNDGTGSDVSHLYKTLEDLGNSIENSLSPSKNLKRGPASVLEVKHLKLDVIDVARPPVPQLAHGLSRVLFNPGVAHVRDPRSRVLNFDAHLEKLMPVRDFDFDTLNIFTPPSKDQTLANVARDQKKKYVASTSSMTGVLKHFHFLLSKWRAINFSMLSKIFPIKLTSYTKMTRAPEAIFLKWKDGVYAVDADKMYDSANVLSLMGRYMEKLLTLEKNQFDRHKVGSDDQISHEERQEPEAFHYSTLGDIVLRSQLDAYDERLPGTGMFDLKTRAVIPIRMDSSDFEWGMDYEIRSLHGEWQSFEREYHDMIRSTMLKYSLQVRMGRMDGIFVAFHNIARIFGFQYVSLDEMDNALHGQSDRTLGDQEFVASVKLMNDVFNMATEKFPKQNIRFHVETRETTDPFMYIFAEPVSEEVTHEIQSKSKAKIKEWEESILSPKLNDDISEVLSKHEGGSSGANEVDQSEYEIDAAKPNVDRHQASIDASLSGLTSEDALPGARTVRSTPMKTINDASANAQDKGAQDLGNIISAHAIDIERNISSSGAQDDRHTDSISSNDTATPSEITGDTFTSGDPALLSALRPAVIPGGTSSPPLTNNYPPLLAFQLYVQNRVNGRPVTRPHNPLTATDEWTIHHTFAPIESPSRAWALYNACKARRHKEMSEEARQTRGEEDYFKNILRNVTEEGRIWREGLEEAEREGDARKAAAREQS